MLFCLTFGILIAKSINAFFYFLNGLLLLSDTFILIFLKNKSANFMIVTYNETNGQTFNDKEDFEGCKDNLQLKNRLKSTTT